MSRPSASSGGVFTPSLPAVASTVRVWYEPIDGSATPLVRPYLPAYGVDLDSHDPHARLGKAS
ncbi:hypothetical protein ABZ016_12135 [Streptomyces sp. NPDC006372]|uniref:hypothetical protein n=1 Tax=Streptomyces sp. NPDC006372 TaxID=3155599 RepID=UPI0033A73FB7